MNADLSPVIAATTHWLLRSYPPVGGALGTSLAEAQARQAVTAAAWLRYPTHTDAALVAMAGPGGSARLDWLLGSEVPAEADGAWRSWVDEVVASWAACLLTTPDLASRAATYLRGCTHANGLAIEFRRLTAPDGHDRQATALLRHPDLLAPVADLHRAALLESMNPGSREAA